VEPRCDVVIVGAGLAGLAAAGEVLRHGNPRLLIVDDRAEAHEITPLTFADVVADFGLEASVWHTYQAFSMHSPLGSRSLHRFPAPVLAALDYRRACQIMTERIADRGSLQRVHARVVGLRRADEGWAVSLDGGDVLSCALVIDASGRTQVSARLLGYSGSPRYSHCYGERLEGCAVDDEEVCYFLAGGRFGSGGGWFYPLGDGAVSFGYAQVTDSPHYPASRVQEGYRRARASFEPYADIVAGAKPVAVETGSIPVGPALPLVGDGLMRVGDAAGQATPWMCMGVGPALVNGVLCGRVAAQAWQRGAFQTADLRAYEREWRKANWAKYRQAMWLAPLQWVADEGQWDQAVAAQSRFSPDEMLAKLRENYPQWSLARLWWFRLYHILGLVRRGVGRWIGRGR